MSRFTGSIGSPGPDGYWYPSIMTEQVLVGSSVGFTPVLWCIVMESSQSETVKAYPPGFILLHQHLNSEAEVSSADAVGEKAALDGLQMTLV